MSLEKLLPVVAALMVINGLQSIVGASRSIKHHKRAEDPVSWAGVILIGLIGAAGVIVGISILVFPNS